MKPGNAHAGISHNQGPSHCSLSFGPLLLVTRLAPLSQHGLPLALRHAASILGEGLCDFVCDFCARLLDRQNSLALLPTIAQTYWEWTKSLRAILIPWLKPQRLLAFPGNRIIPGFLSGGARSGFRNHPLYFGGAVSGRLTATRLEFGCTSHKVLGKHLPGRAV